MLIKLFQLFRRLFISWWELVQNFRYGMGSEPAVFSLIHRFFNVVREITNLTRDRGALPRDHWLSLSLLGNYQLKGANMTIAGYSWQISTNKFNLPRGNHIVGILVTYQQVLVYLECITLQYHSQPTNSERCCVANSSVLPTCLCFRCLNHSNKLKSSTNGKQGVRTGDVFAQKFL